MTLNAQAQRLLTAGVADGAGVSAAQLAAHAARLPEVPGAVLAVHPTLAAPGQLAGLLRRGDRSGFVVEDMIDVDQFTPIQGLGIPDLPLHLVADPTRGEELPNTSPNEALTTLRAAGRTPLTLNEGISWLLQDPTMLTPGACFMTIGSRKHTAPGHLDVEADRVVLSATAVPSVRQAQVEELTDVVESARFVGPE